jgi:hypothetical protein
MLRHWEGGLAKRPKTKETDCEAPIAKVGELRLTACETRRLMSICVELLELCCHVSGKIDPAAGWMVAHARDEVMIGVFGVRP